MFMDLEVVQCEGVQWIHLAQNRDQRQVLTNMVFNLQIPRRTVNFLKG
jgi:hypothetical protein